MKNRREITRQIWSVFLFCLYYLCIGFSLGTLALNFFVRSLVSYIRKTGWMESYEHWFVIAVIIFLIVFTFFLTKWLILWARTSGSRLEKYSLFIICWVFFFIALAFWLTPKSAINAPLVASSDGRFVIGPYPDLATLKSLKKKGFTGVISLMSPLIIPFEPILMKREKKNLSHLDLKYINIPMVPWIHKNTGAIREIKALATSTGKFKYYVHCWTGIDRTRIFLLLVNSVTSTDSKNRKPRWVKKNKYSSSLRYIQHKNRLYSTHPARGYSAHKIVSAPNEHIAHKISQVVSIWDHEKAKQYNRSLINIYSPLKINFFSMPYKTKEGFDPNYAFRILDRIKKFKGYTVIHSFKLPPKDPVLEAVLVSDITGLPTLPKAFFKSPLALGEMTRIGPNVLIGPQPKIRELARRLHKYGVRSIIYIGSCQGRSVQFERLKAESSRLKFFCFSSVNSQMMTALKKQGPWYIYGPGLNKIKDKLVKKFKMVNDKIDFIYENRGENT
jgi:hypothetical protein